jgi:hypothetical protein
MGLLFRARWSSARGLVVRRLAGGLVVRRLARGGRAPSARLRRLQLAGTPQPAWVSSPPELPA